MTEDWSVPQLLRMLAARGAHPAVIVSGEAGVTTVDSALLAARAAAVIGQLRGQAIRPGAHVALWGPNSPAWIAAALGVMAAGCVLVPIDDQAESSVLEAALRTSRASLVLTGASRSARLAANRALGGLAVLDIEAATSPASPPATGWESPVHAPAPDDPAALFWTSGTTGAPKAFFLSHGNISCNVLALRALDVVGEPDRALLPLPLHHAYPFVVGMLTTLTLGTPIVLPGGVTGPLILRALRDGEVTAIIGVPRLYDALAGAIGGRAAARGLMLRLAWQALLRGSIATQRATGLRPGRVLFAPVRRAIAPRLRYLISGGARLERETAEALEALGWTVLSGYGLAETASLFTGNTPLRRRAGSAGRPLATGQVRIVAPDADGIGEIELKGPSITAGYLDNPEANAASFTPDGWFHTGDRGYLDRDGFLFVTGRSKEILVLGGGTKVNPEDLERVYNAAPELHEVAVLEHGGALVALVRPDPALLRARGAVDVRDGTRVVLAERALDLPSYQKLSGFALTDEPLPRTRLGKYRRFLLPDLYARALRGGPRRTAGALDEADAALLRDPTAAAVWDLLRQRYPDRAIDLDVSPAFDLGLDSFGWMELGVALEQCTGVRLTEADIAGIDTLRDLVQLAATRARGAMPPKPPAIVSDTERWLAPTGALVTAARFALYGINRLTMRGAFRLRARGVEHIPAAGPFVVTPNHLSDLDAMAIAAALPVRTIRRLYWSGDIMRLFGNRLVRAFCRTAHVFPVDARYPDAAVATAARVLEGDFALVWFPEGWRSPDGRLQRFLPGIGELLLRSGAPAVPAWIEGAFEALPRGHLIPRLVPVTLSFGPPVTPETLLAEGSGRSDAERVANALRGRVVALAREVGAEVLETVS